MYQQREPEASSFLLSGLWDPEVLLEGGRRVRLDPTTEDRYVVIDEIIEDVARLAVALWPQVDVAERLRFGTEESQDFAYERRRLQSELDRRRESEDQLPRPLRVGDVFFVRGFDEGDPTVWQRIVDITMAGRGAAKRAGLRAVAQMQLQPREIRTRDLSWRRPPTEAEVRSEQPPPPSGSTVNPAV
jgi:hypothetical protein